MEESEMVWIATIAVAKGFSYEELKYSDYLYGKERLVVDAVWKFVQECEDVGRDEFAKKYKHYKLYFA